MIEDREDPTVLDIMTDMRALQGIVTVRQTRPISDPVTNAGHRIVELNVSPSIGKLTSTILFLVILPI